MLNLKIDERRKMGRRSRRKTAKQSAEAKPVERDSDGKFAISLALAMRKSEPDNTSPNAVAQNRNERLDALSAKMARSF